MTTEEKLKRPLFLQLISVGFILAPLGNILISMYGTGHPNWYYPNILFLGIKSISNLDLLWLGLTFFTGILLLIQHKTSWLAAVVCLSLTLFINIYRALVTGNLIEMDFGFFQLQIVISSVATLLGLCVIFYFRYPYLDRRAGWFSYAFPRFEIRTPVTLMAQDVFSGRTSNLSLSGALVEIEKEISDLKMTYVDLIFPEIKNIKIKCKVIHQSDNELRLKFRDLKKESRTLMQKWLESRTLE